MHISTQPTPRMMPKPPIIDRSRLKGYTPTGSRPPHQVTTSPKAFYRKWFDQAKRLSTSGKKPARRLVFAGLALVVVFSVAIPVINAYITHKRYTLSPATMKLVGDVNKNLTSKITYDTQSASYYFNKSGIKTDDASPAAALAAQTGGDGKKDKSLYSVKMPNDPSQGITYYDDNLDLSFTLVPQLKLSGAQEEQGRIVYAGSGIQDVFTTKGNGLKDDIVLTKPLGDKVSYSYKLNLPSTLEAKMIDGTGEVGIYSADPALYNNITYGSSADQATVAKARENGAKTNLVFVLPAPEIKQYDAKTQSAIPANASSRFSLSDDNNTLTVSASGLSKLAYPLSIDPSVVTTSTSDFTTGNNEDGNIDYSTGNQINRGGLSGGSLNASSGSWGSTTALSQALYYATSVAYNGYIYELGGNDGSAAQSTTYYAPLNSNGTIGTWTSTTALPQALYGATSVAYNGYIYELGGYTGSAGVSTTYYAPLNSNGTIGTWTSTTALSQTLFYATSAAYNGYIYELGGYSTSAQSTTYYAPLNANGTIGTWTSTTALSQTLYTATSVVSNGYIYELGGYTGSAGVVTTYYAPLNANGTIGTWTSTTALPVALGLYSATSGVYNGYVYVLGGSSSGAQSATYYAPLNANGTIGTWTSTTALPQALYTATSVVSNGYVYELGGYSTSAQSTSYYAKIDPAGATGAYSTTTALSQALQNASSVAYNGYLYEMGGQNASIQSTTYYAPLNANGTIGTWTSTTALPQALYGATSVVNGGYVYVLGGYNGSSYLSTVYYAPLNADGTIGTWNTTTALTTAVRFATSVTYNGYIYEMGGYNGSYQSVTYYAPINSNGTIGSWTSTTAQSQAFSRGTALTYGGYVYVFGGYTGSAQLSTTYYAPLNTNGTIGTWATTTTLPSALDFGSAVVSGGFVYLLGGENGSGTLQTATYDAPINSNGTIGSWNTTTSLSQTLDQATAVAYNGYVYELGGYNGSAAQSTSYYALINNGGQGTAGSWSTSGNSFTTTRQLGQSVAYKGFLYMVGGTNGTGQNDVQYATISSTGTVGTWSSAGTGFTNGRYGFGLAVYNGYLYVMGGSNGAGTTYYNDVQYAAFNTNNGTIGSWTTSGNSFSIARQQFGAVAYNGYLYVIGGEELSTNTSCKNSGTSTNCNDIQYAAINGNGSISAWTTSSNYFNTARYGLASIAYNGYLYVMGGTTTSPFSDVQYAVINTNGTIGSWGTTTGFVTPRYEFNAVAANGYVYIMGGGGASSSLLNDVQYAAIGSNGTLGTWGTTSAFTTARSGQAGTIYNGMLYVLGGYSGTLKNDVQYAPVNAIARIGHYSKLVDLGSLMSVYSVSYNGTLPGGTSAMTYRMAGTNGIFGSLATVASLNATTGGLSCTGSGVSARYVWVDITMDDSGNAASGAAVFPDSIGSNNANITDFTVSYSAGMHPVTAQRLRLGQTLQAGTLSGLDTCV